MPYLVHGHDAIVFFYLIFRVKTKMRTPQLSLLTSLKENMGLISHGLTLDKATGLENLKLLLSFFKGMSA